MVHNTYTITNQRRNSILRAKQTIALLACFYFCTAQSFCDRNRRNDHYKLRQTLYNTSDQDVAGDDNDLDECLLKKALQGDAGTMNYLKKRGKDIDGKTLYKPGWVRVAIVKNSDGDIALVLEYARKGKLLAYEMCKEPPITLIVESVVGRKHIELIERLLKHKVDLSCQNRWGETLLTEVIQHGGNDRNQIEMVEVLLQAGANSNCLNTKGQTPLDMTQCIKNFDHQKQIITLLLDYNANPLWAKMDETTKIRVRNVIIDQLKELDLDADARLLLKKLDKKLQSFFNQKHSRPNMLLSGQEDLTCVVCYKKEAEPTTIQIPSCGHYVHGSCLVRLLINKSKGKIEFTPLPSYVYEHLCPCCEKHIEPAFIKDLSQFYGEIKFEQLGVTRALRLLFFSLYGLYFMALI